MSYPSRRGKPKRGAVIFGKTLLFLFFAVITFGAGYFSAHPILSLIDFVAAIF